MSQKEYIYEVIIENSIAAVLAQPRLSVEYDAQSWET
jgi:hypothetical protein